MVKTRTKLNIRKKNGAWRPGLRDRGALMSARGRCRRTVELGSPCGFQALLEEASVVIGVASCDAQLRCLRKPYPRAAGQRQRSRTGVRYEGADAVSVLSVCHICQRSVSGRQPCAIRPSDENRIPLRLHGIVRCCSLLTLVVWLAILV